MDQSQTLPTRGHVRNKSSKSSRPRSSTIGPLDEQENPLASPSTQAPQSHLSAKPPPSRQRPSPRESPLPSPRRSTDRAMASSSHPNDFSFLLRPEIYRPLKPHQPRPGAAPFTAAPELTPDTPLPTLLTSGHFRAAAMSAAAELAGIPPPSPTDHTLIFNLVFARLASLVLIDATPLAAQESKPLEEINSPGATVYADPATGAHVAPWPLRVMVVRLQGIGFGDMRRTIVVYYDLAREARSEVAAAAARRDNSAKETWRGRLADLGLRVAAALVEMDDTTGAAAHMATLGGKAWGGDAGPWTSSKMRMVRALLWLRLGDVKAARASIAGEDREKVADALCDMADGEFGAALEVWKTLRDGDPQDEMLGVNTVVCLLYLGRMGQGKDILQGLVESGCSLHTLLLSLTTIYELCGSDWSRNLKMQLEKKMTGTRPSAKGQK